MVFSACCFPKKNSYIDTTQTCSHEEILAMAASRNACGASALVSQRIVVKTVFTTIRCVLQPVVAHGFRGSSFGRLDYYLHVLVASMEGPFRDSRDRNFFSVCFNFSQIIIKDSTQGQKDRRPDCDARCSCPKA
jgi:hypothetical protein